MTSAQATSDASVGCAVDGPQATECVASDGALDASALSTRRDAACRIWPATSAGRFETGLDEATGLVMTKVQLAQTCAALGMAAGLLGCQLPTPATDPQPPQGMTRLVAVWRAGSDDASVRSVLLRDDGDGLQEVGRGNAITVLADGKVWTLSGRPSVETEVDCGCAPMAGFGEKVRPKCVVRREVMRAVLATEEGDAQQLEAPPAGAPIGGRSQWFEVRASVGPIVLGAVCRQSTPCGAAHGSHKCEAVTWDVEKNRRIELLAVDERAAILRGSRGERDGALGCSDQPGPREDDGLARVDLKLGTGGILRAEAVFTEDTSYADSSGWAAYKALYRSALSKVPERLRSHAVAPQAVRRFLAGKPKRWGWSSALIPNGAGKK